MSIKYDCPKASKRNDDISLWEIATEHFCNISDVSIKLINEQKDITNEEYVDVIRCLIEGIIESYNIDRCVSKFNN